jgi:hypothetical protein
MEIVQYFSFYNGESLSCDLPGYDAVQVVEVGGSIFSYNVARRF